jgi:hypothetical protein
MGNNLTALQELIKWFNERPEYDKSSEGYDIIEKTKELLNKEKQQIINAYCKGFEISAEGWNGEYGIDDFNKLSEEIKAEQYYNETYK